MRLKIPGRQAPRRVVKASFTTLSVGKEAFTAK